MTSQAYERERREEDQHHELEPRAGEQERDAEPGVEKLEPRAEEQERDPEPGVEDREPHAAEPPPAAQAIAADEQLTVPEDRDAAAAADGRRDSPPAEPVRYEVIDERDRAEIRQRWEILQAAFVDDPKGSAEQADALVGELVERLQRRHKELRDELGGRFDAGAGTEEMRQALLRYRAFYQLLIRT